LFSTVLHCAPTFRYELSTSQTPLQQTPGVNLAKDSSLATIGGGFGPVSEHGYGVSYIVVGEDLVGFHISSKVSATNTVRSRCASFTIVRRVRRASART